MVNRIDNKDSSSKARSKSSSASQTSFGASEITSLINDQITPLKIGLKEELENTFRQDINEYKAKIIEVLAIFVALFTFVSVDIQVFKTDISTLAAMGFTLIMLGGLLLFIIVLFYTFNQEVKLKGIFISSMALILIGIVCVGYEHKGIKEDLSNNFYTKEQVGEMISSVPDNTIELNEFKKCLKAGGWSKCF